MRARSTLLGVLVALAATAAATAAPPALAAAYVDPFSDPAWQPSRTDMGVDWAPLRPMPVVAIGDALILGSEDHSSWPGHHEIWYQLLDGSHAGDVVYVAEHLKKLLPAGRTVKAGQQIAIARPGYPWTEWGWADPTGTPRAFPCYKEGRQTNSGKEMARFLARLGAPISGSPGRGPDGPWGRFC
jgi:hypothetical protein